MHDRIAALSVLIACLGCSVAAQTQPAGPEGKDAPGAIEHGATLLLSMQEGETKSGPAEWPYEGVYRVRGEIPIGYRIGGTAICASAIVQTPGYGASKEQQAAAARATRFVLDGRQERLMDPAERADAGYDVRGWGYTYALRYLLILEERGLTPEGMEDEVRAAIQWYVDAIQQTEIPKAGGWNYAGARGAGQPYAMSPFMTGPTLQALFEARQAGYDVDEAVVERGLAALERARTDVGAFVYSGSVARHPQESVPGSAGRMLVSETTLLLAGRGSVDRVRGAIDAFIVHWEHFDARRQQHGTHVPPYGIAPYYFYYAHYYAAQAIEQLPARERAEYRRRLHDLIFRNRLAGGEEGAGGWNDRVFPRSANYGTAMCMLALLAPDAPPPARWTKAAGDEAASP